MIFTNSTIFKSVRSTALATAITLSSPFNAYADPTVVIHNKNGQSKKFDCALLIEKDERLHLTAESMKVLDPNQETIRGAYTKQQMLNAINDDRKFKSMSGKNMYLFLAHLATMHGECVTVTAAFEEKVGVKFDVDKKYTELYGADWRTKMKDCVLIDARDACKKELNLN